MNDRFLHSLFSDLLRDLAQPANRQLILWQLGVVLFSVVVGWTVQRFVRAHARQSDSVSARPLAAVVGAFVAWFLVMVAQRSALALEEPASILKISAVLLLTFALLRLTFYLFQRVFKPAPWLSAVQRLLFVLAFLAVALHVTGLLSQVLNILDVPIYSGPDMPQPLTLLQLLSDGILVVLALIVSLWAGAILDARLMEVGTLDASLRVALARIARALLIVVAVLVSMRLVGIPLGVLSVFGGALGVGLGLGLQRIASNYVSGFIILLDRSLRIGDLITVDKYSGSVAQIRTRYTVVRALDGTEAIIPNEVLVSSPVTNQSYTSKEVRVAVKVVVGSDTDVDQAMALMAAAAAEQPRVLKDPAPLVTLNSFAADGLELELGFWVADPESGTGMLKSDINRRILASFRAAAIDIPYPQRDIRVTWEKNADGPPGPEPGQRPGKGPEQVEKPEMNVNSVAGARKSTVSDSL